MCKLHVKYVYIPDMHGLTLYSVRAYLSLLSLMTPKRQRALIIGPGKRSRTADDYRSVAWRWRKSSRSPARHIGCNCLKWIWSTQRMAHIHCHCDEGSLMKFIHKSPWEIEGGLKISSKVDDTVVPGALGKTKPKSESENRRSLGVICLNNPV